MSRSLSLALALALVGCTTDIALTNIKDAAEGDVDSDVLDSDTDADPVDTEIDPTTEETVDPGEPDINVYPPLIDFGTWVPNCESDPETFVIENLGDADLTVSEITLKGVGQIAFSKTGEPAVLAPNESMEVQVVFTPHRVAEYEFPYAEIISDDPDEGQSQVDLRGEGNHNGTAVDEFLQEPADAVDVLFSIDYSGSMSGDIQALGQAFPTFIASFVNLGLDYRIAIVTADPDCPAFQGPIITPQSADPEGEFIRQTTLGSTCGGEAAFGASMNALSSPYIDNQNANFLRADANLAVVAISDEPEQTESGGGLLGLQRLPVSSYVNFLSGLKGGNLAKVSFSGIVLPRNTGLFSVCGGPFGGAPRYHDAINRTGGVFGNLCQLNLDPFLQHVSLVAAGVGSTYVLSNTPLSTNPGDIVVEINGSPVAQDSVNGFSYDASTNTVELHGNSIPGGGDTVRVSYPAEGSCSL